MDKLQRQRAQPEAAAPLMVSSTAAPPLPPLFSDYRAKSKAHDEAVTAEGTLRPVWGRAAEVLAQVPEEELDHRWDQAVRLLRGGSASDSQSQGWHLDPIPYLIAPEDWATLREGLIQRAALMNRLLADVYGYQELLRGGVLPPELVFSHPGFLRACHGLPVPQNAYLHFYAVDVARGADGQWYVLADSTQASVGAGAAFENRLLMLRILPELYHELGVKRLAPFFQVLRETLRTLARRSDNPRIAVLTPGPREGGYGEHVYLARHLGLSLVEGGDLTVRDNQVYLKTLGGLLPVDVLLRRVEDSLCDPLELNYDSTVGVPGLVEALHGGNVAIANALGSGLASSPALVPFLDRVCQYFFGEELKLPSAPMRWCGEPGGLRQAQESLARLLVRPAHPGVVHGRGISGAGLSAADLEKLRACVLARPRDFVVQQPLPLATAPCWIDGKVQPRPVTTRCYVVATPEGYEVMVGGLTRIASADTGVEDALQDGGATKDTWVLSNGSAAEGPNLLQHVAAAIPLARSGMDMPSRIADNLFWLGRYMERMEVSIRTLRRLVARLTDERSIGERTLQAIPELEPLLQALLQIGVLPAAFPIPTRHVSSDATPKISDNSDSGEHPKGPLETRLWAAVTAPGVAGNLRDMAQRLRQTAWTMRDRLSADMWRIVTGLEQRLEPDEGPNESLSSAEIQNVLETFIEPLAAFSGFVMENTTRGPGWRFLDMGRRLERAFFMTSLLRAALAHARTDETQLLQGLLEVADSSLTYRSRYLSSLHDELVLDLLLLDETNPRSVAFQLEALSDHVQSLTNAIARPERTPEERILVGLLAEVRAVSVEELSTHDAEGHRPRLAEVLDALANGLPQLSTTLANRYFTHSQRLRHLAV